MPCGAPVGGDRRAGKKPPALPEALRSSRFRADAFSGYGTHPVRAPRAAPHFSSPCGPVFLSFPSSPKNSSYDTPVSFIAASRSSLALGSVLYALMKNALSSSSMERTSFFSAGSAALFFLFIFQPKRSPRSGSRGGVSGAAYGSRYMSDTTISPLSLSTSILHSSSMCSSP